MSEGPALSRRERIVLWLVALAGLLGLNGVFVWALLAHRDALTRALHEPVALAFVVEALVMTAVLAWLLTRWRRNPLGPAGFVVCALVGGLAFAVPLAALLAERARRAGR